MCAASVPPPTCPPARARADALPALESGDRAHAGGLHIPSPEDLVPNASTAARTAFGRKPPGEMIVIVLVLALGIAAIIFGANAEAGGI